MIKDLPLFLRKSKLIQETFLSEEKQFQRLSTDIEDLKRQLSIDTATWALSIYEKDLNIPTNLNKPLSERRSVIKSKLRGTGKVDALLIKIVADAYTNGDVSVIFNGVIEVKFNSKRGIPPNIEDLQKALEDIKPAHLALNFQFTFTTWNRFDSFNLTWNDIDALNKTWDEIEVM